MKPSTLGLVAALLLVGCGTPTPQAAATIATETATLTLQPPAPITAPPNLALPTQTSTPSPTIPPPTATLDITTDQWPTPLSLMLHRKSAKFDTVAFLRDFVKTLKENDVHVVTYQQVATNLEMTLRERGKLVIISIDDIHLIAPIPPDIQEMIEILREAGYPAVLGVVTEGISPTQETVETLKELSALGWEIATHTDTHKNLAELENWSPGDVRMEIRISCDKIEKAIGIRPITLILPEGQMVMTPKLVYKENIRWAVGINGGVVFDSTDRFFYVGRESPGLDAAGTFRAMMQRFAP